MNLGNLLLEKRQPLPLGDHYVPPKLPVIRFLLKFFIKAGEFRTCSIAESWILSILYFSKKFEAELGEIRNMEIWRAGKALRSLRPEIN